MEQPTADGKGARSGRTPTRPARAARLSSLRSRVTAGVAVAAFALAVITALVIGRAAFAVRDLERSQYAGMATETRFRLERLASRDRTRVMDVAFSDALYQLVNRGAAPPDSFIRPPFVERFAALHGDRLVAVYDMEGIPHFLWTDPSTPDLAAIANDKALFRMLDNREPAVGLIRRDEKLYWVAGAPVLPTNYTDAKQPIIGYLVVAQPFNQVAISPAAADRSGRLELAPFEGSKTPFRTRVVAAGTRDSVRVEFTLPDVFAQQNTMAALTTSRNEFVVAESKLLFTAVLAGLIVVGVVAAAWFGAMRWLVGPTIRLSEALAPVHQGQAPSLVGVIAKAAEWTTAIGAINRLITGFRAGADRFERLSAAGADGLWERDLATGEWTTNSRFRELLGLRDGDVARLPAALVDRIHSDDAGPLLQWLNAAAPSPAKFGAEVRIREAAGKWRLVRFEGSVSYDSSAVAARVTGRVTDLAEREAGRAETARLNAERDADRVATGAFLSAVAAELPAESAARKQLEIVGAGLAGTLVSRPEPFDLAQLLQQAATTASAELTIIPGVPDRVIGDRELVRTAIERLIGAAGPGARTALRAEKVDWNGIEAIRIAADGKSPDQAQPERVARTMAALATGAAEGEDPLLDCRAAHYLATAMGGSASAEAAGYVVRRWVTVPLPAAPMPAAPEVDTLQWENPGPSATFEVDSGRPSRPSQRVELVADATVTIDFDETLTTTPPVSQAFLGRIQSGDAAAIKAGRMALADIPNRLVALKGAAQAGEIHGGSAIAAAIAQTAATVEARPLARACRDLVDATEIQYLESIDDHVRAIDDAWSKAASQLDATLPARPVQSDASPRTAPIDPAALEQLTASFADGAGVASQLVTLFLAEGPGRVAAIERAAESGDGAALRSAAGDLKGMCALIGAGPLAARCAAAAEATGPVARMEALAIRAEWERVQRVLDGLLSARTGA